MKKYPLTSAGVEELLAELYELPQPLLEAEADALLENFRGWVIEHFDLSEAQVIYLNQINQKTVDFMAFNSSFAMENRLPIVLDKAAQEYKHDDPPAPKIIITESKLKSSSGSDGSASNEGEMIIAIRYGS
ncbi:MAG: hypothetical protein EOO92_12530 [Pedobacter sp.]|nr:MAG: hypothetical protein EOO92_12530 [Pedobacter sp.]